MINNQPLDEFVESIIPHLFKLLKSENVDTHDFIKTLISRYTIEEVIDLCTNSERNFIRVSKQGGRSVELPIPENVNFEEILNIIGEYRIMHNESLQNPLLIDLVNIYGYRDGLVVKPSQIRNAGYGIYAIQDIKKGIILTEYGGGLQQYTEDSNEYVMEVGTYGIPWFLNARLYFRIKDKGRWLNSAKGTNRFEYNCSFEHNDANTLPTLKIVLVAKKVIQKDDELFVDYGKNYPIQNKVGCVYCGSTAALFEVISDRKEHVCSEECLSKLADISL